MAELSPVLKQATPVVASRGEGVHLYDEDDRRYLDFTAGIGVTSTGHCHPRVVAAAQEQVGKLIHGQYTTVLHQPLLTLVDRLGEVLPPEPGPDVLRQQRIGGHRGGAAARPPGHRPTQRDRLPRRLPRPDRRGRLDDHVRHQVPLRVRAR